MDNPVAANILGTLGAVNTLINSQLTMIGLLVYPTNPSNRDQLPQT